MTTMASFSRMSLEVQLSWRRAIGKGDLGRNEQRPMLPHVVESAEKSGLYLNGSRCTITMSQILLSGLAGHRIEFCGMPKVTKFGITAGFIRIYTSQVFLVLRGPCQLAKETGVIDTIASIIYFKVT